MSGIVTMEDVLEELVGEIFNEHVKHTPEAIKREADGSVVVAGTTPIREINRALGIELPEDGEWITIAGLCLSLAGRLPSHGQSLEAPEGIILEVVDVSPRRIRLIRVRPPKAEVEGPVG
jgi:putative hemolysin